ncbi:unnamed protein product [Rotaria sp. Silwood2]|nr:unnamed protein product [Rotaria sp. Silwood2]CAF4383311.1 unnamed protein product [Rotaria sp. Silwood2]
MQNILNLSSYQNNPEEYIRSHLNDIIPLMLYTWSIANKPQFPKDTQIITLLLFIHCKEKGLIKQIRTGEDFVNYKIERWVDSAFQARIMREDDHFVLDISKIDEQNNKKTIIVLDKDTGVE